MKIRKTLLIISLIFSLIATGSFIYFMKGNKESVDLVAINHVVKTIEKNINSETIRIGNIENLNYEVIFCEDRNYEEKVNDALKDERILVDFRKGKTIVGKVIFTDYHTLKKEQNLRQMRFLLGIIGVVWAVLILFILKLNHEIIRPFQKLQNFSKGVAKGNLNIPLYMEKKNYFGAFTESFDLMREELKRARQAEYEANISKKELVAGVSHDIKTPVASIKAICELMQAKFDTLENRKIQSLLEDEEVVQLLSLQKEKLGIIYHKADIIDQLTSNMLQATMEELEMLKIEPTETDSTLIVGMIREINHFEKIHIKNKVPQCLIYCDVLRLSQVIDNVVSNSYKYADTDIDISFSLNLEKRQLIMKIKDFGPGVDESEISLLCQKYFRGKNQSKKNTAGSGLGMYLAKLFMEGMEGSFDYYNENGFVVEIGIRII